MWSNLFPTGDKGNAGSEEGQKAHIPSGDTTKQTAHFTLFVGQKAHIPSGDTTELHKGLVYQLISQINRRKGNYVSRRLSQNYGLLKVQTDKLPYWISIL